MLKNNKNGFTLIEVIAVIGVLTVTSAILLISNRLSERQISLSKDAAGIASAVSRARSLTLQNLDETICGYGAHFIPNTDIKKDVYLIFKDKKDDNGKCDNFYSGTDENLPGQGGENELGSGIRFVSRTDIPVLIKDVVFYSSDARVKLTNFNDSDVAPAGIIVIKTETTPSSYTTLKITTTGQVSSKAGEYYTIDNFDAGLVGGQEELEEGPTFIVESCIPDCGCAARLASGETCPDGCGGTCSAGIMGCRPIPGICGGKTCADLDNCGAPCVACPSGQYCVNKQCRVCDCAGKNCGESDGSGCGISCPGPCPAGKTCVKQPDNSYQCVTISVELRLDSVEPPVGVK